MLVTLGFSLLGMILWQTSEPPDIAGDWVSEEWGNVILEATKPGRYEGTLSGPPSDGTMDLKWSRSEGRFNGTWKQSRHLGGKLSLRVVDSQIRGAWTTSKKSEAAAGTPRLCLDGIDTHDDRGTLVRNRRRIRSGGWGYCQAAEIS